MPKRTTRTNAPPRPRRTLLCVTELERRDTPAWWAVAGSHLDAVQYPFGSCVGEGRFGPVAGLVGGLPHVDVE